MDLPGLDWLQHEYIFGHSASPNHWNFLSVERDKGVFYEVNEVAFGKHLRMGLGVSGAKHSHDYKVATFSLILASKDRRGLEIESVPMADDLICHAYEIQPL